MYVCGKSFSSEVSFRAHESAHADQLLSCDICTKVKQAKQDLMSTSASDKPKTSNRSADAAVGDSANEDKGKNYFLNYFTITPIFEIYICCPPPFFRTLDETSKYGE